MTKAHITVLEDSESVGRACAELFIADAKTTIKERGVFRVALSGGNTPKRFFEFLAAMPDAQKLDWQNIHLFWVDERYVPADSPQSNYKLARDIFLDKVKISDDNVHRIRTEYDDIDEVARQYEQRIREVFALDSQQIPKFDLIVLGMGVDGHTASLFPNSNLRFGKMYLAAAVRVPGGTNRITLTPITICAALQIVVLVSGDEKAEILEKVLTSGSDEIRYPIQTLWPVLDKVIWLVDKAAAKLLRE